MWNYEPDVMDALIELITSLVCGYHTLQARLFGGFILIMFCLLNCIGSFQRKIR